MLQVVGGRICFDVQFDSHLVAVARASEGRGRRSAGGSLGRIFASSKMGGADPTRWAVVPLQHGTRLFRALDGIRDADLDDRGASRRGAILKRWRMSTFVIFYLVCGVSVMMTKLGIHWP